MLVEECLSLHKWQNGAIQLSEKSLLLFAVMTRVPIEDVEPGEPDTLGLGFGRRTNDNSILDYWLGDLFGVASDVPASLWLLIRRLDLEPIVGPRLRSHGDGLQGDTVRMCSALIVPLK